VKSCLQFALFLTAACAFPCAAQTGTVTFYSYATTVKEQVESAPGGGTLSFVGWLYDGTRKMAHTSRGRFMTFKVSEGEHNFGITFSSKKPGKTSLPLMVESGKHYCVRLSAKNLTPLLVPIAVLDLKIQQVSCTQAVQEASTYKRIDLKRVEPALQADLDAAASFPQED
jgi:hypothetical protein